MLKIEINNEFIPIENLLSTCEWKGDISTGFNVEFYELNNYVEFFLEKCVTIGENALIKIRKDDLIIYMHCTDMNLFFSHDLRSTNPKFKLNYVKQEVIDEYDLLLKSMHKHRQEVD